MAKWGKIRIPPQTHKRYSRDSKEGRLSYMVIGKKLGRAFGRIEIDGEIRLLKNITYNSKSAAITTTNALYNMKTNEYILVGTLKFRKIASNYFSDCPELRDMIISKDLKMKDLPMIVEKYNSWKRDKVLGIGEIPFYW